MCDQFIASQAMTCFLVLFALVLQACADGVDTENFKDFKLIQIIPDSEESLGFLRTLYANQSTNNLDFWQPPSQIGRVVDILVGPSDLQKLLDKLTAKNISYVIAISDLQQVIASERSPHKKLLNDDEYDYERYNGLEDIHNELNRLANDHPDMVSLIDIGKSVENRTLLVIKLGKRRDAEINKASIWIDAGIHAREWIAPATAMYMIRELINGYHTDAVTRSILHHVDFYISPVANPDGYEYSRIGEETRLWRKNRRPAACQQNCEEWEKCEGVDLNRNFDWHFEDSSNFLCVDTYRGPSPFSEPESLAMKEFLEKNKPDAYISLHSYALAWLIPFSHKSKTYPEDYDPKLLHLAKRAARAIHNVNGTKYRVGTAADIMYSAAGCSFDWAKGALNVSYSYSIELAPKEHKTGFVLPDTEIRKSGLEIFEAIKVVANRLIDEYAIQGILEKKGISKAEPTPELESEYSSSQEDNE